MRVAAVRDEEPPADDVPLVRGGLHSLDLDRVREACLDSMVDAGVFGVSVFAALDGDVAGLCETVPRLRSPGTIWVATTGDARSAGFVLVPTDAAPHFDVVLPDLETGTIEALIACFRSVPNPARRS